MKKRLIFVLVTISLLVCSGFPQTDAKDEGVDEVGLDKQKATVACKAGNRTFGGCNYDEQRIKISVISKDAEKNNLTYYYTVSGGKIIGQGANVVWDLDGARPGTYSITVGVGKDSIIKGRTITKNIKYEDCPECDVFCDCPTGITLLPSAKSATRREQITFIAQVNGGSQAAPTYLWKVSGGKITKGQGTNEILVKPLRNKKIKAVEAIVETGGFCPECPSMKGSAVVELTGN